MLTGIAKRRGMGFTTVPLTAVSLAVMMIGLWYFGFPRQVHACSCLEPGSPTEELEEVDAVFAGRVVSIQTADNPNAPVSYFDKTTFVFEVSAAWKGTVHEKMYIHRSPFVYACEFDFIEGEEYIVYAYENPNVEGGYSAYNCSRTALLGLARRDLDVLGEGHAPGSNTTEPVPEQPPDSVVSWAWVIALAVVAVVIAIGGAVFYPRVKRR